SLLSYFFFFQAEDGIRDRNVTGVQTCALPISRHHNSFYLFQIILAYIEANQYTLHQSLNHQCRNKLVYYIFWLKSLNHLTVLNRSEERRVGKECRSQWSRDL